jgi:hypothetical protein
MSTFDIKKTLGRTYLLFKCATLLNSQLLARSKIFKNHVMFVSKYELGEVFQCCLLPSML